MLIILSRLSVKRFLCSRRDAARSGADMFKMNLKMREITQLTFQEWTPNTGAADWSDDRVNWPSEFGERTSSNDTDGRACDVFRL